MDHSILPGTAARCRPALNFQRSHFGLLYSPSFNDQHLRFRQHKVVKMPKKV